MPINYPVPDTYDNMGRLRFDPNLQHQPSDHHQVLMMMQMMQSHGGIVHPSSPHNRGQSTGGRYHSRGQDAYRTSSPLHARPQRSISPPGKIPTILTIPI